MCRLSIKEDGVAFGLIGEFAADLQNSEASPLRRLRAAVRAGFVVKRVAWCPKEDTELSLLKRFSSDPTSRSWSPEGISKFACQPVRLLPASPVRCEDCGSTTGPLSRESYFEGVPRDEVSHGARNVSRQRHYPEEGIALQEKFQEREGSQLRRRPHRKGPSLEDGALWAVHMERMDGALEGCSQDELRRTSSWDQQNTSVWGGVLRRTRSVGHGGASARLARHASARGGGGGREGGLAHKASGVAHDAVLLIKSSRRYVELRRTKSAGYAEGGTPARLGSGLVNASARLARHASARLARRASDGSHPTQLDSPHHPRLHDANQGGGGRQAAFARRASSEARHPSHHDVFFRRAKSAGGTTSPLRYLNLVSHNVSIR
jgi:hypothetical protein